MLSDLINQHGSNGINVWDVGQVAEYGPLFVGDRLLTTCNWQQLRLYDQQLQRVATLHHEHDVDLRLTVAAPNSSSLVTVSRDETLPSLVQLWRWVGSKTERTVLHHTAYVSKVVYIADGSRIATADVAGRVKVWDGGGCHQYTLEQEGASTLAFHPSDPARLLVLTKPGPEQQLHSYDERRWLSSQPVTANAAYRDLSWAADGNTYLLHGSGGYELRSAGGAVLLTEELADLDRRYLYAAPLDGGWVLTCDDAGRVLVHSAERSLQLADLATTLREGHPDNCLLSAVTDSANRRLVVTSTDQPPYIWDRRGGSGAYLPHLPSDTDEEAAEVKVVASINRRGNLVATASWGQLWQPSYTKLWAVPHGRER